jgi:hypothetical protein
MAVSFPFRTSNIVSILGCPFLLDYDSDGIGPTDGLVSHGGKWLDCDQARPLHAVRILSHLHELSARIGSLFSNGHRSKLNKKRFNVCVFVLIILISFSGHNKSFKKLAYEAYSIT